MAARVVPEAVLDRLRSSTALAVFVRVGTDPVLRLALGVNDVPITMRGAAIEDETGAIYRGAGRLLGVPELELAMNGVADRVDFSLSGATPDFLARLDADVPTVQGAVVQVGTTALDDRHQPVTDIIPLWRGLADYWAAKREPSADLKRPARLGATLSVGSGQTTRSTASASRWSHAQQVALTKDNPGGPDQFCSRTARYARGYQPRWPKFS